MSMPWKIVRQPFRVIETNVVEDTLTRLSKLQTMQRPFLTDAVD